MKYKSAAWLLFLIQFFAATIIHAQMVQDLVSGEVSASREKVYINEVFQLVLSITSTGVSLDSNFQLSSMPAPDRLFMSEFRELPTERNMQGNRIREKRRFTCNVRAIATGILDIAPVIRVTVVSGFGPFRQLMHHDISTKPLTIQVLPLPETGKPPEFSGAIGQFNIGVDVSPQNVAVGELITVTTTIHGQGYLDPVKTINIPAVSNFKTYPAKAVPVQEHGIKCFEQIMVPQNTNATTIPLLSLCFFDPFNNSYVSVSKGPFAISFHPQKKGVTNKIYRPAEKDLQDPYSNVADFAGTTRISNMTSGELTAAAIYWSLILMFIIWLLAGFRRRTLLAGLVLVIASICFAPVQKLIKNPKPTALMTRNDKARLAPAYSASISFDVTSGSIISIVEVHGSWSKIEIDGKKGWMPSDALTNSTARTSN